MSNSQHAFIANRLADLYKGQRGVQVELRHQDEDFGNRILAITPLEGWPGKNEEQRRTAKEQAIAADETCQHINARRAELLDALADTEGEIDSLREQRDALRWQATAKLADALEAKYIGRKQIAQAEAIDAAVDDVTETSPEFSDATARAIDQVAYPDAAYAGDEIPF